HRDVLEPKGATFVAKRAGDEADCEFFASTDTWCQPVCLTLGPDGAIYVLDFYREVIETPLSLPEDMKEDLPLHTQRQGRIRGIVAEGPKKAPMPKLGQATREDLVKFLDHPNYWWRITAQRLIAERQDRTAIPLLIKSASGATSPEGRVHAMWTLLNF